MKFDASSLTEHWLLHEEVQLGVEHCWLHWLEQELWQLSPAWVTMTIGCCCWLLLLLLLPQAC